jgi:hypothetical protein
MGMAPKRRELQVPGEAEEEAVAEEGSFKEVVREERLKQWVLPIIRIAFTQQHRTGPWHMEGDHLCILVTSFGVVYVSSAKDRHRLNCGATLRPWQHDPDIDHLFPVGNWFHRRTQVRVT